MEQSRRKFIKQSALGTFIASSGIAGIPSMECLASGKSSEIQRSYKYSKDISVDETKFDIIVVGGGPAGIGASVSAARLGAKVLLVEATGWLGGMGTSGFVTAFDPMANGTELLVRGIMQEIVMKLYHRGFLGTKEKPEIFNKAFRHWTSFQLEGYKLILDELVSESGVEVRFFTRIIDADIDKQNKKINGLIQQNVEGLKYLKAKKFIDCTGDAVLTHLCGAPCREAGKDSNGIMASTLCAYYANIDYSKTKDRVGTNHPLLLQAIEDGHFSQPDKHLPGIYQISDTMGYANAGHVFGLNSVNCKSLSKGMMTGRKIAQDYVNFYKKYVPGFEHVEMITTAPMMGIRESRRIVGEYMLCYEDYLDKREFPDQIGVFNKSVDIHAYDNSEEEFQRYYREFEKEDTLKPGEYFGIPYSILVPKGWTNLWTAGRCNSSDVKVHGSIRVQPAANMMGQAVGTAAVQSIRTGQPANDLNTETLIISLKEQGVYLPQKTLSKVMTRS